MKNQKSVLIYCDATFATGIGHLARSVSIATAARAAGWEIKMVGDVISGLGSQMLSENQLIVHPQTASLDKMAMDHNAAVIHVDSYEIGHDVLHMARKAGAILSSMEDGVFGRRPADIVIDSSIGSELPESTSMQREEDGSGRVLRGIKFAPIRAEVLIARADRQQISKKTNQFEILIVLGGTDAKDANSTIARICSQVAKDCQITLISSKESWQEILSFAPGIGLVQPSSKFLELASKADLVISAAGTTTWELACMGVPALLIAVTENQIPGYLQAVKQRIARGMGTLDEVITDSSNARKAISMAVSDLRKGQDWGQTGMEIIDGLGAHRIIDAWEDTLSGLA